jgi:hypothetical protein
MHECYRVTSPRLITIGERLSFGSPRHCWWDMGTLVLEGADETSGTRRRDERRGEERTRMFTVLWP